MKKLFKKLSNIFEKYAEMGNIIPVSHWNKTFF